MIEKINDEHSFMHNKENVSLDETSTIDHNDELFSKQFTKPTDYIDHIKQYISDDMISKQNYSEIQNLTEYFTSNVTSFHIFESRLNAKNATSDYCFAVSSHKGEREYLGNLIKNEQLPDTLLSKPEWKQLGDFVHSWNDPTSMMHDSFIGLWFEFDTADKISDQPTPSIFLQPKSNSISSKTLTIQQKRIVTQSMSLLLGKTLSKKKEEKIMQCISHLPAQSSIFQIGTMLSRKDSDIRLVIKRIQADQIIPYLQSIGWKDTQEKDLSLLLEEIQHIVTRFVLHISVGTSVNPKIGIECSFYPDRYQYEHRWKDFLDYLLKKGLCNKEKYEAILNFSGSEPQPYHDTLNPEKYTPTVLTTEENQSTMLIRYISHIKLVYQPGKTIEAKAYPAVRLFGYASDSTIQSTKFNNR